MNQGEVPSNPEETAKIKKSSRLKFRQRFPKCEQKIGAKIFKKSLGARGGVNWE